MSQRQKTLRPALLTACLCLFTQLLLAQEVLILSGHPSAKSLNAHLESVLFTALEERGVAVQLRALREIESIGHLDAQRWSDRAGVSQEAQIAAEQEFWRRAEHIILLHPVWWWSMPAPMKAYLDVVLSPGFAYPEGDASGPFALKGKSLSLIQTAGAPDTYIEAEGLKEAYERLIRVGLCDFTQMEFHSYLLFGGVMEKSPAEIAALEEEIRAWVKEHF
ncbi:NAD(P)H dehydrogenase [Nitritalea halalkaliphila LW7]|uniref:NAD(P)H dehydrogenase n=2 Tax=Nitritalea TaxID=1187887 RepID=I5C5P2_9BACT|nr:NAD(P)H dehydrogenase [Nitritalea halalkaliphila LW7]